MWPFNRCMKKRNTVDTQSKIQGLIEKYNLKHGQLCAEMKLANDQLGALKLQSKGVPTGIHISQATQLIRTKRNLGVELSNVDNELAELYRRQRVLNQYLVQQETLHDIDDINRDMAAIGANMDIRQANRVLDRADDTMSTISEFTDEIAQRNESNQTADMDVTNEVNTLFRQALDESVPLAPVNSLTGYKRAEQYTDKVDAPLLSMKVESDMDTEDLLYDMH